MIIFFPVFVVTNHFASKQDRYNTGMARDKNMNIGGTILFYGAAE